jgi:site-specific recombinase
MRRIFFLPILLFAVFAGVLLVAPPRIQAITYGYVDKNNTYSNVGAFIIKSPRGRATDSRSHYDDRRHGLPINQR